MSRRFKKCRVCRRDEESVDLTPIFEKNGEIAQNINSISGVMITEFVNNNAPALICNKCIKNLASAVEFRNLCLESDEYFKRALASIEPSQWDEKYQSIANCGELPIDIPHVKVEPIDNDFNALVGLSQIYHENVETNFDYMSRFDTFEPKYGRNLTDDDDLSDIKIHRNENGEIQCQQCMKTFTRPHSLRLHVGAVHKQLDKNEMFRCEECGKRFKLRYYLQKHLKRGHVQRHTQKELIEKYSEHDPAIDSDDLSDFEVTRDESGQICCKICSKIFTRAHSLKIHFKAVHLEPEKIKTYRCQECGKLFKLRYYLKKHLKRAHHRERKKEELLNDLMSNSKPAVKVEALEGDDNAVVGNFNDQSNAEHQDDYSLGECPDDNSNGEQSSERHGEQSLTQSSVKIETRRKSMDSDSDFEVTRNENNQIECKTCGKTFKRAYTLRLHVRAVHRNVSEAEMYKCEVCDKQFKLRFYLQKHIKRAHLSLRKKMIKEGNLSTENMKIEDVTNEDVFFYKKAKGVNCQFCNKFLMSRHSLRHHIKVAHETVDINERYYCDVCGKDFALKHYFMKHFKAVHMKTKEERQRQRNREMDKMNIFPCSICGKLLKNKCNLTVHERTHRVLAPEDYHYCDHCGNKFKTKAEMKIHILKRHLYNIKYSCEFCGKSYKTAFQMRKHVKIIHHNIKEFKCEVCGRDFGDKNKLVAHSRVHTGEQPFQCKYCDRKFSHQTDLRRHQWQHTGYTPFKCGCGRGFMKTSELVSHQGRCSFPRVNVPPQIVKNEPIAGLLQYQYQTM